MPKITTSYFYHVRHLRFTEIPISTACYDPKWFHNNSPYNDIFIDKRGVINGIRMECMHPDKSCASLCRGKDCIYAPNFRPDICSFLKEYRKQIFSLNINAIIENLRDINDMIFDSAYDIGKITEFVFLVHETPANPCSERTVIQDFFNSHGIECHEKEF